MMNGFGKSDRPIVPKKEGNKMTSGEPQAINATTSSAGIADSPEGRGRTKGNALKNDGCRVQDRESPQQVLERIRMIPNQDRNTVYVDLAHGLR